MAMATPRKVWVSAAFRIGHPSIWAIMRGAKLALGANCKWRWLDTQAEYVEAKEAAVKRKCGAQVVGLLTREETRELAMPAALRKHIFRSETMMTFIKHVDRTRIVFGVCGR